MPQTEAPRGDETAGQAGDDRHKDTSDRRRRLELFHDENEARIRDQDATILPGWLLLPVMGKKDAAQGVRTRASSDPTERAALAEVRHDGWAARLDDQLVLDADLHHGVDGLETLGRVLDMVPIAELPTTLGSTPSGGRHLHFAAPSMRVLTGAGVLGPGLDVISGPRQTVTISGPGRNLCGDLQLVPVPAALLAVLRVKECRPRATAHQTDDVDPGRRLAGAARTVAAAGQGGRNAVLNWSAFTAGRAALAAGIPISIVTEVLISAAADAGLDHVEARATVRSGLGAS